MEGDAVSVPAVPRYSYEPEWPMYALGINLQSPKIRLVLGSYLETEQNKIRVVEVNEETQRIETAAEAEHPFISTKLMWSPRGPEGDSTSSLLASTSTTLNLWRHDGTELKCISKLANARTKNNLGGSPPLTSFDWSAVSHHKIGASSVDSTCTIWNLEKQKIETQLIAHDKAVHDIVFANKDCLFASCGADGSVRLFDQRNLDHSTIIYESSNAAPLLRLAWSKANKYLIATLERDGAGVVLIDIRRPSCSLNTLAQHESCVNSIAWSPTTQHDLLCGTDDGLGLVWDIRGESRTQAQTLHWHDCGSEVQQVLWPSSTPDQVVMGMSQRVDILSL
jgi:WD repeat-containing protein 68